MVSHYVWKVELLREDEVLLQMKIKTADYEALAETIRTIHPYDTPEIVRLEIVQGEKSYLNWIETVTRA